MGLPGFCVFMDMDSLRAMGLKTLSLKVTQSIDYLSYTISES